MTPRFCSASDIINEQVAKSRPSLPPFRRLTDTVSVFLSLSLPQLLCHRAAPRVSAVHDAPDGRFHAGQRVDAAGVDLVHAHLPGVVHDGRAPGNAQGQPGDVRFRGQQSVRTDFQLHQLLDTGHRDGDDVLPDI